MRFVVIGDIMIDETVYGGVERISPEAPVPVLSKTKVRRVIGGAGNVATNLRAICPRARVDLIGIASRDCLALLNNYSLNSIYLYTPPEVRIAPEKMNVKLRFIDTKTGYQLLRVDNEDDVGIKELSLDWQFTKDIIEQGDRCLPGADAVIISDYCKGAITEELARSIISHVKNNMNVPVFVDTRRHNPECFEGASYITPNVKELKIMMETLGYKYPVDIPNFVKNMKLKGMLLTKSEEGMELRLADDPTIWHRSADNKDVVDVTGAGDTALAAFAAAMTLKPSKPDWALEVANILAGEVCLFKGTAVPENTLETYGYNTQV